MKINPAQPITKTLAKYNRDLTHSEQTKSHQQHAPDSTLNSTNEKNLSLSAKAKPAFSQNASHIDVDKVENAQRAIREGSLPINNLKLVNAILHAITQHH